MSAEEPMSPGPIETDMASLDRIIAAQKERAFYAAVVAQIHLGVAKARANGVVCGSPIGIRIKEVDADG